MVLFAYFWPIWLIYIPHQLDKNKTRPKKTLMKRTIYIPHQLDKNYNKDRKSGN